MVNFDVPNDREGEEDEEDENDGEETDEVRELREKNSSNLFANLAAQPCEVVFAAAVFPDDGGGDASQGADGESGDGQKELVFHDLDTGNLHRIAENEAEAGEDVGRVSDAKNALARKSGKKAWGGWWQNKQRMDEKLWSAAAGPVEALEAALAPPEDGSASAQVNSRSLAGRTALHIAASGGTEDCVRLLLKAAADVAARTDDGLTPLHVASQVGNAGAARCLLAGGAEPTAEANDQSLALHYASAGGHSEVCGLLLNCGREQLLHSNHIGQRPLDVSMDIATFDYLSKRDREVLGTFALNSPETARVDSYAGRLPFHHGGVMLRNSRSDVVQRLIMKLHRTTPPRPDREPMAKTDSQKSSPVQRFVQLRQGSPTVEEVNIDSFTALSKLGQGSFGQVLKVSHKKTQQIYAMKILEKSNICASNSLLRYTITERNLLSYMRHPYIVSLHYAFQTPSHLVLVLEFCPNGNMQNLLRRNRKLGESWAKLYAAEVLLALTYLHQRQTVYRDLKPENVVLDEIGHAMLTDFGLSKEKVAGLNGTKSFCGSIAFMAPEIIRRKGHGHTVDIYGLGVLVFCFLVGSPPFYDKRKETLLANIKHATLAIPPSVPQDAADFVQATMRREPKERLGAEKSEDCQAHAWFADSMDFAALMRREVPLPEPFETLVPDFNTKAGGGPTATPSVYGKLSKANARGVKSHDVAGWNFASPSDAVDAAPASKAGLPSRAQSWA